MSDRFSVVESLVKQPGCCFFCRGLKTPMIDTAHWIPAQGVVYLCGDCISEMYEALIGKPSPIIIEVNGNAEELNGIADALDDLAGIISGPASRLRSLASTTVEQEPEDGVEPVEGNAGEQSGNAKRVAEADKSAKQSRSK